MNPIVTKELRTTSRSPRFLMFLVAALLVASVVLISLLHDAGNSGSADSRELFNTLFGAQAVCLALAIPAYAGTSICLERERRTFDYLLLSELTLEEIVGGKFAAVMSYVLIFLVAFMPLSVICFLYGGISPGLVVLLYVFLLMGAALTAAFCVMVSARLKSPVISTLLCYVFTPIVIFIWAVASAIVMESRPVRILSLAFMLIISCWSLFSLLALAVRFVRPRRDEIHEDDFLPMRWSPARRRTRKK